MANKPRVAIYIRVSTLNQVDKDSLPMQRKDLIAYAQYILNTDDYVIFEDAGYSGKNTERPSYQDMMAKIKTGAFTHLLVWKIDRISRNLLDFSAMYKELKDLGVTFISKNEQFDTSTAMGEAMLKIILVFAELERNITAERVTATMISRASSGLWNGGRIPYGYDYNYDTHEFSINEHEAAGVRLIHDRYDKLHSLVRLSKEMNESEYLPKSSTNWNPTTLHKILTSQFYTGDYVYNRRKDGDSTKEKDPSEWVLAENHHPAIISHEQKDRIVATLSDNNTASLLKKPRATKNVHIFQSVLYCDRCNKFMNSSSSNSNRSWRYSKYSCSASRNDQSNRCRSTSDAYVGEFIFNYILNMLSAKKNSDSIITTSQLQKHLLRGVQYRDIQSITGLEDFLFVIHDVNSISDIFGKTTTIQKESIKRQESEQKKLRNELKKLESAMQRLVDLYLYSTESMSQSTFMTEKAKISSRIDEISEQLELMNHTKQYDSTLDDESFMQIASEFILANELSSKNHIYFKNLYTTVPPEALQAFIRTVIDNIGFDSGRIVRITFRNGMTHHFHYREATDEHQL